MTKGQSSMARMRGFTLIEAVMVIVLMGIIATVVSVFITRPIQGYSDAVRRAEMTDATDAAIRRMARDVRSALPNSLRANGTQCIEFLPIVASGRYRNALDSSSAGQPFDFSTAGSFTFDVLGGVGIDSSLVSASPYHVVVFNLGNGIDGSDAYAGLNRRAISAVGASGSYTTIQVGTGSSRFRFTSPGLRFHVIPNYSVQYSCSGGKILRTTQEIAAAAACPASVTSSSVTLIENVDCSKTAFNYAPGAMQRDGLLNVTINLTKSGESLQLFDEIHVNNVP